MTTPSCSGLTLPKFARQKTNRQIQNEIPHPVIPVNIVAPDINVSQLITPRLTGRSPAVGIVNTMTEYIGPRTPLLIPKIGQPTTPKTLIKICPDTPSVLLQPDENPWLRPCPDGASDVKIISITPIGTIPLVPTSDRRLPSTPRKIPHTPGRHLTLRVLDENTGEARIDPIFTASIYLDCTKPEDQDYNHVAERMRTITANTVMLQKQYSTELRPLINVSGRTSYSLFEEALLIYENNQVYYQDRIDDHTLDILEIRSGLTTLEHWFMSIIEPKSQDDEDAWRIRESNKLTNGFSAYCDPELHQYIQPMSQHGRNYIRQQQAGLL